jgi:hypothetical protein
VPPDIVADGRRVVNDEFAVGGFWVVEGAIGFVGVFEAFGGGGGGGKGDD